MEESKANITGRLQAVKRNSGKSYGEIANETGLTNVYVAQLLRRQAQLKQETAEKLRHSLPELTEDFIHEMMKPPMRSYDPNLIREPCVYRLKEAVAHFGESIKEIIDEEFGDGIMSAIDFYCSVDKVKGVDGEDRVVVTFDGKYLPYREEVTHVPPEQSQSRPKRAIVTPIVTPTWEQLLGSDDWDGILDPLYLSLRKLILRCGDFAEATYDAFDNDSNSDNRGNSLYPKETLFESVKVKNRADYEIASFLYATSRIPTLDSLVLDHPSERSNPWDPVSNWMGYVAITTDTASNSLGRREIYVVWRGTTRFTEWGSNLTLRPVPITPLLSPRTDRSLLDWFQSGEPKVHRGWLDIYTSKNSSSNYVKKSARDQLWDAIDDLKGRYNKENLSIVVTGHSLGGSLATLSAFDLAVNGFLDNGRVAVFAFSCPKVGNEEFKKKVESYPNLKILHTHIRADLVPNLPGSDYVPIRTAELEVQTMNSPYVQLIPRPIYVYNLEVVLHMVAGWNGANNFFGFKVDRELALVNKWTGFLIDRLNVPDNWWPDRNKPGSKLKYDDKKQQWGII